MTPFFSILVPCCDVAPYVRECLESVQKQPFQDWECLVIVETSNDNTEQIVREVISGDKRFRLFTQPRSGSPSAPRNTGLDYAIGKYIVFLDGDDSIAEKALQLLHDKIVAQPDADIYPCAIWEFKDGTKQHIRTLDNFSMENCPQKLSGHDATLLLYNYWPHLWAMVPANIYRRKFLVENNLRFVSGLQWEDCEHTPRAFYLAKSIVPLHAPFYLYRRCDNSITQSEDISERFFRARFLGFKSLFHFHATECSRPGFDSRIAQCWAHEWIRVVTVYFFPAFVQKISQQKRREALSPLFNDGFEEFKKIAKAVSLFRQIAAGLVRLWFCHPSLARFVEFVFCHLYFPLAELRNKIHGQVQHSIGTDNRGGIINGQLP